MSSQSKSHPGRFLTMLPVMIAVLCTFATLVAAQDQPAPKWELYGGYSFFHPGADVHGLRPGALFPLSSRLEPNPRGAGAGITYNFNRWFGLTLDTSTHWGQGEPTLARRIDDAGFSNLSFGPKITFRHRHFSPFLEVLLGDNRLMPAAFHNVDKLGFMFGGGLDINLSRHVALRLLRADYIMSSYRYGPAATTPSTDIRGVRLQTGLVFMWGGGGEPAAPVAANCSVRPGEVMVGEPVTATVMASNFNPKHTLTYSWTSTGGKIEGKDNTASVDTNGVAGGNYTATAHIVDPKVRKGGEATCSANFTVKEPPKNPPAISCLANPSTVQTGTPSTISCTCTSPDNVPVTVSGWTASGGSISSSGGTTTLNTTGAPAGPITVSATCTDSRELNTQARTQVMVENPPVVSPEVRRLETRLALHSVYFPTARPTAENPTGGLLDSQQKTLLTLASDFQKYLEFRPNAHLTLEGHADPRGSEEYNQALSERRVERARSFLIEHNVPAANIETKAFGKEQNLTDAQVKDAVEQNPELTPQERQRILNNMRTIILASNRRVDITLSTTGQQSTRQFPFNAADSLTLIKEAGTKRTVAPAAKKPMTKKNAKPAAQQ